jgi:hypothetical protein
MTDKKLKQEIENKITEVNAVFLIKILEKALGRDATTDDMFRIKMIPIIDKNLAYMVSFDDIIIGVMEGSLEASEERVRYICDFIPAEDYKG